MIDLRVYKAETEVLESIKGLITPSNQKAFKAEELVLDTKKQIEAINEKMKPLIKQVDGILKKMKEMDRMQSYTNSIDKKLQQLEHKVMQNTEQQQSKFSNIDGEFRGMHDARKQHLMSLTKHESIIDALSEKITNLKQEAIDTAFVEQKLLLERMNKLDEHFLQHEQKLNELISKRDNSISQLERFSHRLYESETAFEQKMQNFEPKDYNLVTYAYFQREFQKTLKYVQDVIKQATEKLTQESKDLMKMTLEKENFNQFEDLKLDDLWGKMEDMEGQGPGGTNESEAVVRLDTNFLNVNSTHTPLPARTETEKDEIN